MVRFFLGAFAMIGALVFLGCPWRALLRLAGGDGNALFGLFGLVAGIWVGTLFLKGRYSLGRSQRTYTSVGWILPLMMVGFLLLLLFFPPTPGQEKSGVLFYSLKGPGSMHAPLALSLGAEPEAFPPGAGSALLFSLPRSPDNHPAFAEDG